MATDPYKYFRIEAGELVEQLGKGALDLEKGPASSGLVGRLLRLAHTLKGAARVVKQAEIADLAHSIEDALAPHRTSAAPIPRNAIDVILKLLDGIGGRVAVLPSASDAAGVSAARIPQEDPLPTTRADVAEMDELLEGIVEVHAQLGIFRENLVVLERADMQAGLLLEKLAPRSPQGPLSAVGNASGNVISAAEELAGTLGSLRRSMSDSVDQADRELRQVRDAAERLRLVPSSVLFTSLERSARDVARAQGKRVAFEGRGGDLRLDTQLLSVVHGALLQIVRNAVAHGIEFEGDRKRAGKPLEGQVLLEVIRLRQRVVFRCRDDGRGIDVDAVRQVAERKGLLSSPEAQKNPPEELVRLLLLGGISTSSTVTEISGRGVGLDVVREATERLHGEVSLRTESGRGVTVEIVVPISLSSMEALVVESSGMTAAIPIDAVRNCVRVAPDGFTQTPDGATILSGDKVVPFLPLARIVSTIAPKPRTPRSWSTVIVQANGDLAAFGVDRLRGITNVILRPLPDLAPVSAAVAGVSLDAAGNPQLVLDPGGLIAEAQSAGRQVSPSTRQSLPVLVIDDSLTTRMLEQSILESAGYEVDLAVSGEDALEKAHSKRYALFLVDVEMPGIDGFTFIERARADHALRDVPSVLVTSRASAEDMKRGEEVGAQGYVVKGDFNQEHLLERIRKLVG